MSTQLRCPWCQIEGVSHVGSYPTPKQVAITYCRGCLAVRGVIPLKGKSRPPQAETLLRCPWCDAAGLNRVRIAALGKGWIVVACRGCGAIHGLTPLVESKPAKAPAQPAPPRTGHAHPAGTTPQSFRLNAVAHPINMGRRGGTLYQAIAIDDGPPYCLACERDMEQQVVPQGYKNSGKQVWFCPNRCGAWEAG